MSTWTYPPRLRKAMIRRRPVASPVDGKVGWNVEQFGQSDDYYTFGGGTGCTHTAVQWFVFLWTGKKVTHDQVSKAAGYPLPGNNPAMRGLYPRELQDALNHYGVPMKVVFGLTADQVRAKTKMGPVGIGHLYSHWPDWYKYRLGGSASDGEPNGYASPRGHAGKTQSTWNGAHFGVILGQATHPTLNDKIYGWEPNHGSANRPEKPPYDSMTILQFTDVYDSYKTYLGRTPYAVVPTKSLPAAGY